jgi:hypothetical protein
MATNEKSQRAKSEASKNDADGTTSLVTTVTDRAATVVKGRLTETVDKSVEDLDILAKTLQLASQQLKDNVAAPYVGKVADRVSRLSRFIDEADAKALLKQAQSLGREKPLLFFGGAMALGFAGGRFLRSSSSAGTGAGKTASKNENAKGR